MFWDERIARHARIWAPKHNNHLHSSRAKAGRQEVPPDEIHLRFRCLLPTHNGRIEPLDPRGDMSQLPYGANTVRELFLFL